MTRDTKSIVLIGMMGAGKSTIGAALQKRTGAARFDTDESVVAKFGLSISQIFARHGEAGFRDMESEILADFAATQPTIVVTGGGIVLRQENVNRLRQLGMVVWLDADEEVLFERATRLPDRPLLQGENARERFAQLILQRRPLYAAAADARIDTSASVDQAVDAILREMEAMVGTSRCDVRGRRSAPSLPNRS